MRFDLKRTEQVDSLAALRQAIGISQAQVAAELGASQPGVLKLERSSDPRWSTIARYVDGVAAASGGTAQTHITVAIGRRRFCLALPADAEGTIPATARPAVGSQSAATEVDCDVWRLRAWDDPTLEECFLTNEAIAMSADEIGDLSAWPNETELRARLRQAFPDRTEQAIGTFASYWRMFRIEMQPGDIVVVPLTARRVAIGEITGDYLYDRDEPDTRFRHRRSVRWVRTTTRSSLDEDIRKVVNAPGTICRVNAPGAAQRTLATSDQAEPT